MPFNLGYPHSTHISKRPGYTGTSLQEVALRFPSEDACFEHISQAQIRRLGPCTKCGTTGRWYRRRSAKYVQHPCGAVFSPLAGTVFHASKLPLRMWFYAFLHFANSSNGVNTVFLERHLSISYSAAFRMGRRIRLHMAALESDIDFAEAKNLHTRIIILRRVRSKNRERTSANIFLVSDGSRVNTWILNDPRRHNLAAIVRGQKSTGRVLTTDYRTWRIFSAYGQRKPLAELYPDFFHDDPTERDAITGFKSYFELPFILKYKHSSTANLNGYIKEYQFLYNRRENSKQIFWDMVKSFPKIYMNL